MKRTRVWIAFVLLFALLLSSCGQPAVRTAEPIAEEPAALREPAAASPVLQPLSGGSDDAEDGSPAPQKPEAEFRAKFEGSEVSGSGESVDGVYRFIADQTDGEAWHVKLECNYPTVSGRDYRVTYRFVSDVAGKVKFGDFQEYDIQKGENSVTGMIIATGGTSYLDLQLGMLPPFTIDFTEVEVEEFADEVDYEDALDAPVNFEKESLVYERHDQGYAPVLTRSSDGVSINYLACSWDPGVWKSKLFVKTGLIPEKGERYRVTADIRCDQDMPFELLFNNGDEEKGYGALYGQRIAAGQTTTCEAVVTGNGDGDEMILQFSLGEAPEESTVDLSNLRIQRIKDHYTSSLPAGFALDKTVSLGTRNVSVPSSYSNIPLSSFSYTGIDTVYEGHDDGYVVALEESADSATMKITQAPEDDRGVWKAKLYAATGLTLEAGQSYRVKFDLHAERDQAEYEVCFDGSSENAYGALYGRSLTAGGTDSVEYLITPDESHGPLVIRLQLGKTDTTSGNTFTLNNLSVETMTAEYKDALPGGFSYDTGAGGSETYTSVLPESFSYRTGSNVHERHAEGYEQSVSASDGSAVLSISAAPEEGRDLWNSQLLIETGFTPEPGTKYQVDFEITGEKAQAPYEICFDGSAENAYGVLYDQSLSAGAQAVSYSFTPEESRGPLTLRFQLGATGDTTGNTITVSKLSVKAVSSEGEDTGNISYLTDTNVREEHDHGIEQMLSASGSTATLTISQARSSEEGGVYSSRLLIHTGVTPEAGARYRVSAAVGSSAGLDEYELVCDNGGAENGYPDGKRTGLQVSAGGKETINTDFTAPESGCGELVLRFQLGNSPAGNTVTVSDIQVRKLSGEATAVELPGFTYPSAAESGESKHSFELEANSGAEAELSGDGSSATATVTTPGEDWNVKLYAKPGLELETGNTYRVSLDVTNAEGCQVCFKNTNTGAEDGFGSASVSSGHVSYDIVPASNGTMEILLKLGAVPAGTAVKVSNVQIEKGATTASDVLPSGFTYPAAVSEEPDFGSFDLTAENGAAAELSGDGSSATAKVTTPGDDWHIKFYAKPALELETGKTYTVSLNVSGMDGKTVFFKNTATGDEEGFGTETISSGSVTHTIIPASNGVMEIMLKLGDLAAGTEVTVSGVKITANEESAADVPVSLTYPAPASGEPSYGSFSLGAENGAAAELSGNGSSATAKVTTPGDDWHIKFYAKPELELEAGKTYTVSLNVSGMDGKSVYFKNTATGAEDGFGTEDIVSGGVTTHTITPSSNGVMEILLKLGNLAAGTEVTVSGVKIEEIGASEADVTPSGFAYPVTTEANPWVSQTLSLNPNVIAWDDSVASASSSGNSATLNITTAHASDKGGVWSTRLQLGTGVTLEAGAKYQISATVSFSDPTNEWELMYSNGQDEDDGFNRGGGGYGYGPKSSEQTQDLSLTIEAPAGLSQYKELVLRFQVGNSGVNTLTVSDLSISKYDESASGSTDKKSFNLTAENGAAAELSGNGSSATAKVTTPGDDWHIKFYALPELELQAGKTYTVSLNVTGMDGKKVYFKNRATGDEEGFGTETIASGSVSHTITPETAGVMEIMLKLGDLAAGTEVSVSGVTIKESGGASATDVTPSGFAYPVTQTGSEGESSFELTADGGTAAELSGDGSSKATAKVVTPGTDYLIKFYAKPGVTLEAGKTYRITVNASGADGHTVFFKNAASGEEEGFGTETLASGAATHTITPESAGELQIMLKIGDLPADTTVTIGKLQIQEISSDSADATPSGFAYPVTGDTPKAHSFKLEANKGAAAELSGDGSSATAKVTTPGDDWHVKFYAFPALELKAGKTYRVSLKVTNMDGRRVCFKNEANGDEEGFGTEELASGSVTHTIVPEADGVMQILLKIGDLPEGTEVKVSQVQLEELSSELSSITPSDFTYPAAAEGSADKHSFKLEANEGAAAELSGNGSSATAKVTVPGDDWHVKFYAMPGVELQAGKTYRVSMLVKNAAGCSVVYKNTATGAEDGFGSETVESASQTVTHTVTAAENGTMEVLLKIGTVPADTEVTVSDVKLEEIAEAAGDNLMTGSLYGWAPINFWAHEDYAASLSNDGKSASLNIQSAPGAGEAWMVKLFAETGVKLSAGASYRISADVSASTALDYEICYNNGAEEKGVGALYELSAGSSAKTVSFDVKPESEAELILQFNLGKAAPGTVVTISNIKVELLSETLGENLVSGALSAWSPVHLWAENGYETSLTNDSSSATLSVTGVPGSDQADWMLKLFAETGAKLTAGKSYRIRYDLKADSAFDFNVFYNNGAEEKAVGEFYGLSAGGSQTVEHTVWPGSDAELTIQLMLGTTAAPNNITISNIQVEEIIGGAPAHAPVNFWAHEDYEASLSNDDSSATLAISKVPAEGREAWKVKLFAETGAELTAGKTYRVSLDVQADAALDYEICCNNAEVEKELGAVYGLSASAEKQTVTYTITPEKDAELILQFNLGNAAGPCSVTISGLKVEEAVFGSTVNAIEGFRCDSVGSISSAADDGYIVSLDQSGSSAAFTIHQAPEADRHPWNVKLNVRTGFTPQPGKGYRVSFDIDSSAGQKVFEMFYDGSTEEAYGALRGQSLPAGKKTVSGIIRTGKGTGELVLQLRLGQTDGTEGNSFTISNLKLEEVTFRTTQTTDTAEVTVLQLQKGYISQLEKTRDKATVRLEKTPSEGREAWKSKLFIHTGVTMKAGQKYRVSMDVKSIIPAPFEVCFNNGDVEKGVGAMYGLISTPSGQYVEYVTYAREDAELVIQLSLGNCSAPNSIILGDVKVEKAGAINPVSDFIFDF